MSYIKKYILAQKIRGEILKIKAKRKKNLEDKLNFVNNMKKSNISKIHFIDPENACIKLKTMNTKKYYKYDFH